MKRIFLAVTGTLFLLNLMLMLYLLNEITMLKEEVIRNSIYQEVFLPPMRIEIQYTGIDKTEQTYSTFDNMIDTGNAAVDRYITDSMQRRRQRQLTCNFDKPMFEVREMEGGATIISHWPECSEIVFSIE